MSNCGGMWVAEGVLVRRWAQLLLLLAASACSVNPVPEPPARPPGITGTIEVDRCTECDGKIFLHGATENATEIWAVNLDSSEPPSVVNVAADGTFSVAIGALSGHELRLQARSQSARSEPVDFLVPDSGALVPALRPLGGCLTAVLELDFGEVDLLAPGASRSVIVDNACADAVTLSSIGLRVPTPAFAVDAPVAPFVIPAGESVSLGVVFDPETSGLSEEILLIEISNPSVDRRPVTLFGLGSP